jgi:hypothetical protein
MCARPRGLRPFSDLGFLWFNVIACLSVIVVSLLVQVVSRFE